jgi:hypothetical protein
MENLLAACGAITEFHGFATVCFMYQPATGRLALLAMNPRQGAGMHLAPGTFGSAFRALLDGCAETHEPVAVLAGTLFRLFPQDLERALRQAAVLGFTRAVRTPDVPWHDRGLLRAHARYLLAECKGIAKRHLRALTLLARGNAL